MPRFLVKHGGTFMAVPGIYVEDVEAQPLFVFFETTEATSPTAQCLMPVQGKEALVDYGDGRVLRQLISIKAGQELTTLECVDIPFENQNQAPEPPATHAWPW